MDKMDNKCSPEEIEKKRLLALQRRQQAQLKTQTTPINSSIQQSRYDSTNVMRSNKSNNRFNPIEAKNFFSRTLVLTGKCYMINQERFALEISSFVPAVIETFKTLPSRAYDAKSRIWNFHINDYDSLMEKLMHHEPNISIARIPQTILQIFKKSLKSEHEKILKQDLTKIDKKLTDSLMPFQQDGICFGISKGGRCMIADDMGLGKTIQALGIAHYFQESWPLLIVVPSSVRFQWSEAIYQFLPSIPMHYVHHFANAKDCIGDDKITITSYDILVRAVDTFEKYVFGFVILDESHVLKSNKTARFQAAQRICAHARHVVLLTGTPALSRPIELHSQISLILPRFIRYEDYGVRYCAGQKNIFGWDFTGSSNMQELQLLLKATCMIRRLKVDVLNQLPSKIRQVIILDPVLIKTGKRMNEMSKQLQTNITSLERHNTLLQYYSESSFARIKAVCNYVTTLFENKRKCLLYAHHKNILDAICNVAESMKIRYIRIDGRTNPEQRKHQIDKFQERDDYLAAILSITAANAGVTLTAAHLVVFTELFWNPGILCQAEDRVHRIGQNDNVIIQYLVAKDTADDYIWPLIKKKLDVLNAAGLDQDLSINNVGMTAQKEYGQQDLTSFISISLSPEEQSQSQENKKQKNESVPETSVSTNDFKQLLEIDEEYFDSCNWDDIA
ncbi:SWI/SNF-related matrix-associated actin-dependent regulator of chromatin subfamily A-like protein 1 [Cataglyphis hispanica]|uniref:SWI/SNF-related matrix-associated actin-dependent regulator of chromatin subfamily A-like protein 1 n=1 Tax=Cataglyphis hispanica TaxID=1086592 RepID=UPI00217FE7C7|nr:SWI/SNF-related matrix-associated actin-dependent regulator of chromatin subfamily A-like protein 1 [Cataglyphis hispanica]XP_050455864.1 SWI/SNF-related matrix-associated actin-dependent regulator of chromatin subfamily A-like protein 1 [Cataglyphis hispanica]XP_050455873.1 SWI/SNF-related matrix-associated actin-dependent regulator of chromatin subfamily A-like protein 1 [Cataglyphis hispanica]XP_050455882.1 SWI/SNF-related matrix-associated actin-dependent regulator of chromatin subfamily 